MGEMRNTYRILVGMSEAKRSLRKPRSSWEDNIKIVLKYCRRPLTGFG